MTKTQLIKKIIKEFWFFILAYITNYVGPKIKEIIAKNKDKVLEYLWNEIKDDLKAHITGVIVHVEEFFNSTAYDLREKIITDSLFEKIKLPVLLRPMKSLIKKILRSKIHAFIRENLTKAHKKLDEMA